VERFDKLILVTAPEEVKIARFVSRMMAKEGREAGPPTSQESRRRALTLDARARIAAQISDQEKVARCNYVIDNTRSLEETGRVVEGIYRELVQASR
jgi:dephospho-CoA kinase